MPGYFEFTLSDEMGLQRQVKFCECEDPKVNEEMWMRIYKLWDRVIEPRFIEPDGQGVDAESDRERSQGDPRGGDVAGFESNLGFSKRHGGEPTKRGYIPKDL